MDTNTAPLDAAVEFADNPEPRCPCVLLLDTSGAMKADKIKALNEGRRASKTTLPRTHWPRAGSKSPSSHSTARTEALLAAGTASSLFTNVLPKP